ncbi:hypothetical protein PR048_000992 [Dryococelus australis]|uniref:Uncharacterized protein n=1 Tax=Dryococelus australis TaxID=614101 RepID=A0ABQ9IH23_9NEOP|nr:hypothetical protein PR048_000992 [Dryococelus australis]
MVLGEENSTIVPTSRVQGVRWVSHKKKCLDVLVRNYNVIVSQLENLATGNKSQADKLSGIVKTMKNISNHLSKLSLALQSNYIDKLYALTISKQLYSSLASMTDCHFGDTLSEFLKPKAELEEDGGLNLPGNIFNLCIYGDEEINFLCTNYKEVLGEKGITADRIYEEWKDFKTFLLSNLRHITGNELWTMTISCVKCKGREGFFSTTKRVKTDYQNRLQTAPLKT